MAEASEEILNDEELINTLDQSKETSTLINERMIEAEKTAKEINQNRELYRVVAIRGSVLYFVIADLANIDPMYQYSLEFFTRLFRSRLENSKQSEVLEERLEILLEDVTEAFYVNICRGLFEKDKLLYSYLNASSIVRRDNRVSFNEWNFFVRGPAIKHIDSEIDYLDSLTFLKVQALEEVHANFIGLKESFQDASDSVYWKDLVTSDEPWTLELPSKYEKSLSNF